jgi:pyruvate,orthophosphate dikinase
VGQPFPESPLAQLKASVEAVLQSWMSERAQAYRKMNSIADSAGTATIVQSMVFGNAGPTSGSGVGFTRNPSDGTKALYVDFLPNAQGEDVVSGRSNAAGMEELERRAPQAHRMLVEATELLENEFLDMQDFEFTVEDGRLFILQARSGKRTPLAALRIATDLVREGKIPAKAGLALLEHIDIEAIETLALDPPEGTVAAARAVPASTGVAVGVAVFDPARLGSYKQKGKPVILLRERTETTDISALADAEALVTAHGARTSHAAVVARQLGKVCLVGCQALRIDASLRRGTLGEAEIKEGETITVDGTTGLIFLGAIPVRRVRPREHVDLARSWSKVPYKAPRIKL